MDIQAWWNALDGLMRVLYAIAVPATCVLLIQLVLILIGLGRAGGMDAGGADGAHPFGDSGDAHGGLPHGADPVDGAHLFGGHLGDADGGIPHGADPADGAHLLGGHLGEADGGIPHGTGATGHDAGYDHPGGDGAPHPGHEAGMDALRLFSLSGIVSFFTVFGWSSIILYQNALPGALSVVVGLALGYGAMFGAAKLVQWSIRLQEDGNLVLENAMGLTARVYIPIPAAGGGEGKVTLTLQERFTELSAVTGEGEDIPSGALVRVTGIRDGALTVERTDDDDIEA